MNSSPDFSPTGARGQLIQARGHANSAAPTVPKRDYRTLLAAAQTLAVENDDLRRQRDIAMDDLVRATEELAELRRQLATALGGNR